MVKILDQKNSRKQGDVGMGIAIGYFASLGWTVSLPLTDSQDYDLIIDYEQGLKTVQVKTTRHIAKKFYMLNLKVDGGNRTGIGKRKTFDMVKVDFIFGLTENGIMYLIPSRYITARHSIQLGPKWDDYIVKNGECPSLVEGVGL